MGDDDKKDPPKPDPKDELGDAGKRALDEERRARREAEKTLKDAQDRLKQLEDKDKSETQKLADDKAAAERERDEARAELLRITVGASKGLTPTQARRLVGKTKEELEADADDLLKSFKPESGDGSGDGGNDGKNGKGGDGKPAAGGGRPTEKLRGGNDPTEEVAETNPAKLAEAVPRL